MTAQNFNQAHRTALLIVDMQNGFCHRDGSFAQMGIDIAPFDGVIEPCRVLLNAARSTHTPVVFFRYVYQADYVDHGTLFRHTIGEMKRVNALVAGSWDAEILDVLAPVPGERVIDKNRPSGFFGNQLAKDLHDQGVERVVICGVTTSCCVEGTVRDAGQHDFVTVVVSDATAEMTQERHDAALHTLGFLFADVVSVSEAEQLLAPALAPETVS